jgi:hypothetical protein
VSSTEAIQRAVASVLQVEIPTASVMTSTFDPSVGEECLQPDLDTSVGEDVRSLDLKAARILSEAVAATWEVHRLWEILPIASRVPGYSEKPVTQKDRVMFNNQDSTLNT